MDAALLKSLVTKAESAYREKRGSALTTDLLLSEKYGLTLLLALRKEIGPEVLQWEPESIWLRYDFSPTNRDKLLAAKTTSTHPTLFTEPRGFSSICSALSGLSPEIYDVTPPPVFAMVWGVLEGELLFSLENPSESPDYSPDVAEYVAIALATEGFVCAPEQLSFADEYLEKHLSDEGRELRKTTCPAWDLIKDKSLEDYPFPDTAEGVQLARLAAVSVHTDNQVRSLLAELP